jgi:hypothetical protein
MAMTGMLRNQQVAGSIPAGGSNKIKNLIDRVEETGWYFGWYFFPDGDLRSSSRYRIAACDIAENLSTKSQRLPLLNHTIR